MPLAARLLLPRCPQTCTQFWCNWSIGLRCWQPAVRNCSNGGSRPVHSESCCQGIRRKQVGNVPAAGKNQRKSRWWWFKTEKERNVAKIGHKQDCYTETRWFSRINLGLVSTAKSSRVFAFGVNYKLQVCCLKHAELCDNFYLTIVTLLFTTQFFGGFFFLFFLVPVCSLCNGVGLKTIKIVESDFLVNPCRSLRRNCSNSLWVRLSGSTSHWELP